jgi:hypothetical protein
MTTTTIRPNTPYDMSPVLVVKPLASVDAYVLWSAVIGAPMFVGTREQTQAELAAMWRCSHDTVPELGHEPAARLFRADRAGASALWLDHDTTLAYDWTHGTFTLREHPGPAGDRLVDRADLAEYTARLRDDDTAGALTLTRPAGDAASQEGSRR